MFIDFKCSISYTQCYDLPLSSWSLAEFQALSSPVLSAVGDRYYKVTAEALRVCGELVRVIRPTFEVTSIMHQYNNLF